MSDANTTRIGAQRSTPGTWAGIPSPPALKTLRLTSESLDHEKQTEESAEVRADRQLSDMVQVGAQAVGGVNFELSYTAWKEWLEAALWNNIVTVNETVTCAISASGNTLTAADGTWSDVIPGCLVKVAGAVNTGNNGAKFVVSKAGGVLTCLAGSFTNNEASPTLTITGQHLKNGIERLDYVAERDVLTPGGGHAFQSFTGLVLDTFNLSIESKKIITGEMTFIGKRGYVSDESIMDVLGTKATGTLTLGDNPSNTEVVVIGTRTYTFKTVLAAANDILIGASASATLDNLIAAINGAAGEGTTYGTDTAVHALVTAAAGAGDTMDVTAKRVGLKGNTLATTTTATGGWATATLEGGTEVPYLPADTDPILNGTTNFGSFMRNGSAVTQHFKTMAINIMNNVRGRDELGTLGNYDTGVGEFRVSGNLSAYFSDNGPIADYIGHTESSLSMVLTSPQGKKIGFHIPRLQFTKAGAPVPGKNQDIMQGIDYTALISPVYDATLLISFLD